MDTKENIHSGHRERLFSLANRVGVENVTEIQAVELLLMYVIPRKDTNPLAHKLLKDYGSLSNIFNAKVEELQCYDGLGQLSAQKLVLLGQLFNLANKGCNTTKTCLLTYNEMLAYAYKTLPYNQPEKLEFFALSSDSKILGSLEIDEHKKNSTSITIKQITALCSRYSCSRVFSIHNHNNGDCSPSFDDVQSFGELVKSLQLLGIDFVDSLIVGDKVIFSQHLNKKICIK